MADAKDWRSRCIEHLAAWGIAGISPLRCEPPPNGKTYDITYPDPRFGTARAIASKNVYDVRAADMILAYVPKKYTSINPAYGTLCELAWGHILGKPTVVVTDDPYIEQHPLINACAGWMLPTLSAGLDVCTGVLGDYAKGVR